METDIKQTTNSLIGYALIILGVGTMLLSMLQVYRVFTKQIEPVAFFSFPGVKLNMSQFAPKVDMSAVDKLRQQFSIGQPAVPNQAQFGANAETEIIPAEVINGPTNLAVYLLFMGFLMNFGYRLASLGITLVRPLIVKATGQ